MTLAAQILAYVEAHPGCRASRVARDLGIDTQAAARPLLRHLIHGRVTRRMLGHEWRYSVAEAA
jgi:predicted transcriptional regulator